MATVAERSKELADGIASCLVDDLTETEEAWLNEAIEQALLAERRLAMEEAVMAISKCRAVSGLNRVIVCTAIRNFAAKAEKKA